MSRRLVAAAAQLGPIHRADSRESVVRRLVDLMRQATDRGCRLVVYPELALTTFFPRWLYDSQDEVDAWFEHEMPNAATRPLFDEAKRLGIGFHLGYAARVPASGMPVAAAVARVTERRSSGSMLCRRVLPAQR